MVYSESDRGPSHQAADEAVLYRTGASALKLNMPRHFGG
jgi:hypothetical protein